VLCSDVLLFSYFHFPSCFFSSLQVRGPLRPEHEHGGAGAACDQRGSRPSESLQTLHRLDAVGLSGVGQQALPSFLLGASQIADCQPATGDQGETAESVLQGSGRACIAENAASFSRVPSTRTQLAGCTMMHGNTTSKPSNQPCRATNFIRSQQLRRRSQARESSY
jgi:hypothetical protein